MLVRMRYQMSGGRHDGRPWPPLGTEIEVPDWEGADLIRGEMAVAAGRDAKAVMDRLAEQPIAGHPSKLDPRPPSQVEGEALAAQAAAELGDPAAVASSAEPPGELPGLAPDAAEADGTGSEGDKAEGEDAAEPAGAAETPGPSAPKQAWIDYAVSTGAEPEKAAAMTKADLMSRYGGRL